MEILEKNVWSKITLFCIKHKSSIELLQKQVYCLIRHGYLQIKILFEIPIKMKSKSKFFQHINFAFYKICLHTETCLEWTCIHLCLLRKHYVMHYHQWCIISEAVLVYLAGPIIMNLFKKVNHYISLKENSFFNCCCNILISVAIKTEILILIEDTAYLWLKKKSSIMRVHRSINHVCVHNFLNTLFLFVNIYPNCDFQNLSSDFQI